MFHALKKCILPGICQGLSIKSSLIIKQLKNTTKKKIILLSDKQTRINNRIW